MKVGLRACLKRIDARDADVRGWAYLDRTVTGGAGPLAGMVLAVKDVIDVAGMPTTHGSPIFAGAIAAADAEAVALLRAAGAAVLGKAVTAEFATYHPGPTANPRLGGAGGRWPGRSGAGYPDRRISDPSGQLLWHPRLQADFWALPAGGCADHFAQPRYAGPFRAQP